MPKLFASTLEACRALQKQTPHMSQLVPQRQLKSLNLEQVLSALSAALQAPPTARRTIGGGKGPPWAGPDVPWRSSAFDDELQKNLKIILAKVV